MEVLTHSNHILREGSVDFIDHNHVCRSSVGFTWMVCQLMSRSVWISDHNMQIRHIEWQVIVATIPEYNVYFFFRLAQDAFVINTSIDHDPII